MREMERGKRSVSGSQILIFDYGGFQIRRNEDTKTRNAETRNAETRNTKTESRRNDTAYAY